jgi:2-dehydro-3-deoxyglucarate aldolase
LWLERFCRRNDGELQLDSLKLKLGECQFTLGSWITLAHPAIAEIMAGAGFDWLVIDLEHSVITIREAEELIRVIGLSGTCPLARLSDNDPVQIKRVMDAGAHGVIVPMVNSAIDARQAVEAVRYPPEGRRGVGLARAQGYGSSFEHYREWVNKESVVIVQVEHIEAVDNLEAILVVEGIDGFIVGPYDLSASLGVPGQFDHPSVKEAMGKIQSVGIDSGKAAGIHVIEPEVEQVRQRVGEGYSFVAYSLDIRMLDTASRLGVDAIRREIP